jgi:hypothetical protein
MHGCKRGHLATLDKHVSIVHCGCTVYSYTSLSVHANHSKQSLSQHGSITMTRITHHDLLLLPGMTPDQFQGDSPAAAATREAVSKVTGVPADQIQASFAAAPGARRLLQQVSVQLLFIRNVEAKSALANPTTQLHTLAIDAVGMALMRGSGY